MARTDSHIALPLSAETAPATPESAIPIPIPILVVDDAITIRLYYRKVLEEGGFTVDEAVNGYEGLEKALQRPFGLLLVDVNMPRMDGYSLVRALRADPERRGIPVIMISTEGKDSDAVQAFQAGANHYIVKPVHPDALLRCVRLMTGTPNP